jgi:hypothetical protein
MSGAQAPCPKDHPLMIAFERWKGSEDYRNTAKWAAAIQVSIVDGNSTISHPHLDGSLWGAFVAGFEAGSTPDGEVAK